MYQQKGLGEGTCRGAASPRDGQGTGPEVPAGVVCNGGGEAGAGRCDFGGSEGGHWPR